MARRYKAPRRLDQKIFKRTAKKVKAINLPSHTSRGGIRL